MGIVLSSSFLKSETHTHLTLPTARCDTNAAPIHRRQLQLPTKIGVLCHSCKIQNRTESLVIKNKYSATKYFLSGRKSTNNNASKNGEKNEKDERKRNPKLQRADMLLVSEPKQTLEQAGELDLGNETPRLAFIKHCPK